MPTALLTLGRLPKALDLARALHGAGWRVIIAEPSKWHLSGLSRHVAKSVKVTAPNEDQAKYLDDLLNVVRTEKVELVVPVSEEALHVTLVKPRLPDYARLFSPDHETLARLHDKSSFIDMATGFGLFVPETAMLGSASANEIAQTGDFIIKPVCTCSGQGFEAFDRGISLPPAHDLPPSVVQRKLAGAHKSTFSLCHEGRVIGTVVYRGAIMTGTVAAAFERLENETEIEEWVQSFVGLSGYSGCIAFDFIEDEAGVPHAIECNPRVTSGVHFVDPRDLAAAILSPQSTECLRFKPEMLMYQFWPCLTETQMSMFGRGNFKFNLMAMWQGREVNFSWTDPLPVWLMPVAAWQIMYRAFLKGDSFGEAATHDIGWYDRNEGLEKIDASGGFPEIVK